MKINQMTEQQIRDALDRAFRNGDEGSKYVQALRRRLRALKFKQK